MSDRRHSRPTCAVFVTVLVVVATAVLVGVLAPAAVATPDAAEIDAFLEGYGSPMVGMGATFIAEGQMYGVDPVFLVAIAGAETSFGKQIYSENGDQCTYNAFNWFYGSSRRTSDFTSWSEAIARVAEGLGGKLYYEAGLYSVDAIAPKYCPEGTDQWVVNVKAFMAELGGNADDTRLAAAVTASPSPSAPSTEPGLVALEGSVKLDQGDREVGQRVYAWFTLTNTGGESIELEGIRLAVRAPGGVVRDQVSDQAVTLAAGQSLAVSANWLLDLTGRWRGWIEVTRDGTASLVGEERAFGLWVKLPRHLTLRRWQQRADTLNSSL